MTHDVPQTFEKLVREELALDRSVSFTGSFVSVANVLGNNPKNTISSWSDPEAREYPLKRSEAWDAGDVRADKQTDPTNRRSKLKPGVGEPPQDLVDRARTKHTQIQTVSLMRESLWEKAEWIATAFLTSPDESLQPVLAPVFRNAEAARQIFSDWRSEVGICDAEQRLRVAIVRGINKMKPYSYRIVIGSNPDAGFSRPDVRYVALVNRINTMDAESDENVERFLRNYTRTGGYFLAPAFTKRERFQPKAIMDLYIVKRELHVRQAWEIGRNDPDSVAVQEDDEPIIPTGQENPPVLELLRWKRERSAIRPSTVRGPK